VKRRVPIAPVALLLAAGLDAVHYWQLSRQAADRDRPHGGSATIEGTEVGVVSRIGARITTITADEGARVSAGQVLVRLASDDHEATLAQAEAQVEAARAARRTAEAQLALARHGVVVATRQADAARAAAEASASQRGAISVQAAAARRAAERVETLATSGGATEQELDRANSEAEALRRQLGTLGASASAASRQADVVSEGVAGAELQVGVAEAAVEGAGRQIVVAEASVARAKVTVAECTLVAPRDGLVEVRAFEPGELAVPGARLLTLVDLAEVRATFYLANADLAAAAPGQRVVVRADARPGETFEGVVRRVGSEAEFTPRNVQTRDDRDRLVYAVEVAIPNREALLRPGMPVEVELVPDAPPLAAKSAKSTEVTP